MINPTPLKRAYIDTGRVCPARCMFCYHKYVPYSGYMNFDELKKEIDAAFSRGNDYIDFTGGEPTLVPELPDAIRYLNSLGMRCCVISCGLVKEVTLDEFIAITDDWLMSVHGVNEVHDFLTGNVGNFDKLLKSMRRIRETKTFRINTVINKHNYADIPNIAKLAVELDVRIINLINFNPHYVWKEHFEESHEVIADLRKVEPILNDVIPYLEENGVGVNVRYYPMCRIKEEYRRVICNDLHVMFDPYEWDYGAYPKTYETYLRKGTSMNGQTEEQGEPCNVCKLHRVCGGINKHFNKITSGSMINAIKDFNGDQNDFYWYRKHNEKTLTPR